MAVIVAWISPTVHTSICSVSLNPWKIRNRSILINTPPCSIISIFRNRIIDKEKESDYIWTKDTYDNIYFYPNHLHKSVITCYFTLDRWLDVFKYTVDPDLRYMDLIMVNHLSIVQIYI